MSLINCPMAICKWRRLALLPINAARFGLSTPSRARNSAWEGRPAAFSAKFSYIPGVRVSVNVLTVVVCRIRSADSRDGFLPDLTIAGVDG